MLTCLQYTFLHQYSHAYLFTVYILTPIFPCLPVYSIHSYTNIATLTCLQYTFLHQYFHAFLFTVYTFLHQYCHAYLFTVYILTPIFPRFPVYSINSYTNIPSFKYTFFHLYFPLYSRLSYTQHFLVYSIHSHTNISRFQTKIDKISRGGCSVGYSRVTCFLMCLFF